jgi:hypothetical protein
MPSCGVPTTAAAIMVMWSKNARSQPCRAARRKGLDLNGNSLHARETWAATREALPQASMIGDRWKKKVLRLQPTALT